MKIERIDIFTTHEDYKRPIPIAVGTHDSRDNVIVRITAKTRGKRRVARSKVYATRLSVNRTKGRGV